MVRWLEEMARIRKTNLFLFACLQKAVVFLSACLFLLVGCWLLLVDVVVGCCWLMLLLALVLCCYYGVIFFLFWLVVGCFY